MRTSASEDDAIRNQRDGWKAAFESGDVDRIMSYDAPGSATRVFDISPPPQFDGTWLVTHDHVSVPVDLHAARAPMDPML